MVYRGTALSFSGMVISTTISPQVLFPQGAGYMLSRVSSSISANNRVQGMCVASLQSVGRPHCSSLDEKKNRYVARDQLLYALW